MPQADEGSPYFPPRNPLPDPRDPKLAIAVCELIGHAYHFDPTTAEKQRAHAVVRIEASEDARARRDVLVFGVDLEAARHRDVARVGRVFAVRVEKTTFDTELTATLEIDLRGCGARNAERPTLKRVTGLLDDAN